MSAKPYDQAFKYLAEQDAESLLILLGCLKPGQTAQIKLLPLELDISTLLPDQPYRVETADETSIVHIEAQTVYDNSMPERMSEYGARLWMKYRLPVRSYVLLLTKRNLLQRPPMRGKVIAGDLEIRLRYRLVKLWEVSARRVLAMKRESLLPFVPLMRGGEDELETGAFRLGEVQNYQKQRDLSLHFLVLGGLRYNREDILDLIGRKSMIPIDQLRESSFYQYIVEEGLKEGREEGKIEGMAKALSRLIAKRFPELDVTEEIEKIRDASLLEQLIVEVIDMTDAAGVKRLLAEATQR